MKKHLRPLISITITMIIVLVSCSGCAPTLIFVDRNSKMEAEALGPWPDFEELFAKELVFPGPDPIQRKIPSKKSEQATTFLPGDLGASFP